MIYTPQSPVEVLALVITVVIGVLVLATSAPPPSDHGDSGGTPVAPPGGNYLPSILSQPGPRGDQGWVLVVLAVIGAVGLGVAWLASMKYI